MSTTVGTSTFDSAGNVTYQSTSHSGAWTTNFSEVVSSYSLNWSSWWLNKIDSADQKFHPVSLRHASSPFVETSQDQLKIKTTTFSAYDTAHRLPSTTTVTANDSLMTQTVSSVYNTYGLPSQIDTTGTDVVGPRSVTTTYTNSGSTQAVDGYFPFTVTNALGHIGTVHTDPKHGQSTSQIDANGLTSTTVYDAFGRVTDTIAPGSPTASVRLEWCDSATWCRDGHVYRVQRISAATARNYTYFDPLGREQYFIVRNFNDAQWMRSETQFDERGNTTFEETLYDPSAGELGLQGTSYLSYDALNRLTSKKVDQTATQDLVTTYTYSGFTTTIDAGGIFMERTFNGLGQLVETKDGDGQFTRYSYDGAGNPVVIADPKMLGMLGNIGIRAAYNALGHKEWVEDPDWWDNASADYGYKSFTYNALGEVLSEIDPNGNLIEMLYDELGRLVERKVNGDLDAKWHFDNTNTYKGLGLLDFEDSQFRPDGSRLQKFYYYSDVATGRKDLLQVTHRFYENDDPNDFTDYDTQYFTDDFYVRPKGIRYPGGTSLAYEYGTHGHLIKDKDPTSAVVYREVTSIGTQGQISAANVANHTGSYQYQLTMDTFGETGQVQAMTVSNNGSTVQSLNYTYDVFGNLRTRQTNISGGTTETFGYDDLQRLTTSTRSYATGGPDIVTYTYDASGSFESKSDYATSYTYDSNRPHVLSSVNLAGGGSRTFSHDENGNMTSGDGETITYNAFNKPLNITNGTINTDFTYGADLMRFKQITPSGSTILYIDKLMEIESVGSAVDYRHYLGDVAILTKTGSLSDNSPSIKYLFRDRLGGISMVGDETASVTETRGYDAFGAPRYGDWTDKGTINSAVTDRGFTDHEHLDDWQLIHMNGRGYDYNIGRFLSIDPFIQDPGNSQSINSYAYIMNNPLSGTDPTGYASTGTRIGGGKVTSPCSGCLSGFEQQLRDPLSAVIFRDKESGEYFAVGADNNGNLYKHDGGQVDVGDGSGSNVSVIGSPGIAAGLEPIPISGNRNLGPNLAAENFPGSGSRTVSDSEPIAHQDPSHNNPTADSYRGEDFAAKGDILHLSVLADLRNPSEANFIFTFDLVHSVYFEGAAGPDSVHSEDIESEIGKIALPLPTKHGVAMVGLTEYRVFRQNYQRIVQYALVSRVRVTGRSLIDYDTWVADPTIRSIETGAFFYRPRGKKVRVSGSYFEVTLESVGRNHGVLKK